MSAPGKVLKYLAVAAVLQLSACGGPEEAPEAQIRALVARAEQGAEDHEISVFREAVSIDYRDNHGYDRRSVLRLVQGMLLRNRNIHLLSLVRDLQVNGEEARARVLVAMAGRPIESADALLDLRADLFRFDVDLARDGDQWRVRSVDWNRAQASDFL
ncbi:MAG TPA: hypothetical protein VK973_16385 [Arenicellales bacterium]|nr:hypothetical protein [Arenicellales bacterium]